MMPQQIKEALERLKEDLDAGLIDRGYYERKADELRARLHGESDGTADPLGPVRPGVAGGESRFDLYAEQEVGADDHRFRLVEPLGSGGMGVVWRAVDLRDSAVRGRELQVALKMLPPGVRASVLEYRRLQTEALRARALSHPNIVNVYDWHEDSGGWVFVSMEYLQGRNLDQVLADEGPEGLPLRRVFELLGPVAEAIDWAYQRHQLVHRDLKPGNILLTRANRIKVLDFGLSAEARSSSSGSATGADRSGTLAYMPPEAFRQTRAHPSRDVYALSVTLYQLLTGYTPWPSEAVALRHPGAPWPDAPDVLRPEQWEALKQGLAYEPKARPDSCRALLAKIQRIGPAKPRPEPRPTPAPDQIEAQRRQAEEARRQRQQRQEKVERERLKAAFDEHLKAGRLAGSGETALSLLQSLHSSHPNAAETAEATQVYRAAVEQAVETALGQGRLDEAERQLKAAQAVLAQERRRHWQRRLIQERAKAVRPQPEAKKGSGGALFGWLIGLGLIGLVAFLGYSWWEDQQRTHRVSRQAAHTASASLAPAAGGRSASTRATGTGAASPAAQRPEPVAPTPSPRPTPVAPQPKISPQQLAACRAHLEGNRLTTPAGTNVWDCYRDLLHKEPTNREALKGLDQIAGRYFDWAETALANGELDKVASYLERARQVSPEHPRLVSLQDRLSEAQAQAKRKAEEEAKRQAEAEERRRQQAVEDEARRQAEAEQRRQQAAEERRRAEREAARRAAPRAGQSWREPVTGMEFVWVPGGCYQMGSNSGESDEKPVHEVCVDGFWMGKTEVTHGQWRKFMGSNPSKFQKGDDHPVEQVSWNDAQDYIGRLNGRSGERFRLPTEAEWEYACRSGGKGETWSGTSTKSRLDAYGNICDGGNCSYSWQESGLNDGYGNETSPVGRFKANGLGLYDMTGNVWEWVQDVYDSNAYRSHARQNPVNTSGGSSRVDRGGSWGSGAVFARCAHRNGRGPGRRYGILGFRLLRTSN